MIFWLKSFASAMAGATAGGVERFRQPLARRADPARHAPGGGPLGSWCRETRVEDVVRDEPGAIGLLGPHLDELPPVELRLAARHRYLHVVLPDGNTDAGRLVHREQ